MTAAEEESLVCLLRARMDHVVPHGCDLARSLRPALDVLTPNGEHGDVQMFAVLLLARRLQMQVDSASGGREVGKTMRGVFEVEIDRLLREGDSVRGIRLPGVILR